MRPTGHHANATNLVDILEREMEGLVGETNGGLDGFYGTEESLGLDDALGLLGLALQNGMLRARTLDRVTHDMYNHWYLVDSRLLSPCQPEIGTNTVS
jgi:hypothetical protein